MRICTCLLLFTLAATAGYSQKSISVITDNTSYDAGATVSLKVEPPAAGIVSIRYAGERTPVAGGARASGSGYQAIWDIPENARTGRYEVDFTPAGGQPERAAASFAVYRKLLRIVSVDLDKAFYTSGDPIDATSTVRNLSSHVLHDVQIDFEPYNYPWVVPASDESRIWRHIVARGLEMAPHEEKAFHARDIATADAPKEPIGDYFSVVARDTKHPDQIYDLAFALPAWARPPNMLLPKQYPFLYLYWHLRDVPKSEAYREFYPPQFVSSAIRFDKRHTMFAAHAAPSLSFTVTRGSGSPAASSVRIQLLDSAGKEVARQEIFGAIAGTHTIPFPAQPPGLYLAQVTLVSSSGVTMEHNRIQLAVNDLPKSILVFGAHEDDETAHPGLIRAAVENHIPIHFVYFTSGEAGGCDRFFMHSCGPARALDFGEVRMDEARASLGHLGVPARNLFFLGLPDGGLGHIWYEHRHADHPYLSVLLATEHAPYRNAAIPNLPYSLDAVVSTTKHFIEEFHPALIVTGHPDERHVDHRTGNWIVVKAMQELLHEGHLSRKTQLIVDVSYGPVPGRHAPYHYQKAHLFVSGEAAKLGQEAAWYYESQDGNHQQARITDFAQLPHQEPYPHYRILDWFAHEGWNDAPPAAR
ncbi:MAG: PIG-L family deacetylase [Bryobacteraceae bacterium]